MKGLSETGMDLLHEAAETINLFTSILIIVIYLRLNEGKHNERDDKW